MDTQVAAVTSLLLDMGLEARSRREPEALLTAAFIAASGAVAWGAAALASAPRTRWWSDPALVGVVGVLGLAAAVARKIQREYAVYKEARSEQGRLARTLGELLGNPQLLPTGLASGTARRGHRLSLSIVGVAALAAAWFCLAVYLTRGAS
jgi:hypothetical protein